MNIRLPMQSVETPVIFSIYSDGWGFRQETWALPEEQPVTVQIEMEWPYYNPERFYAYAFQDGHYTKLYYLVQGDTTVVDLEPATTTPFTMTGVIFAKQSFFYDSYCANQLISVLGPSGPLSNIMTDEYGCYTITHDEAGTYTLSFIYQGVPISFQITNTSGTDYKDLYFNEPIQADAPNIYLYPETETNVAVTLDYPGGGQLVVSDPPYNGGWDVSVSTNGVIDGQYGYLFYEAKVPQPLSAGEGWLLAGSSLEAEFRELMAALGFRGREIDDFMEYWMPLMEGSPWYAVYLQDPAMVTTLNITPAPQNILRCHFAVRALQQPISIRNPAITPFKRSGFTVVEWGVSGWEY